MLEQPLAALPAERRAGAVRGPAGRACAGGTGLLHAQKALDLPKLCVRVLEQRGALDEDVDADLVADRHLVDEAAEIELKLRDARGELVATAAQVDDLLVGRARLRPLRPE